MFGVPKKQSTGHVAIVDTSAVSTSQVASKGSESPHDARHGRLQASQSGTMPVGRRFVSELDWFTEVQQRSTIAGYTVGPVVGNDEDANERHDHWIHGMSHSATTSERFMYHIALAFGDGGAWKSPTVAMIREAEDKKTVWTRLSRMRAHAITMENSQLLELASNISCQLRSASHGANEGNLHDIVFDLYRARIEASILQLQVLFREHREQLDQIISTIFGLFDDQSHNHDETLEDYFTAFYCLIRQLDSQFRVKPTTTDDSNCEMNAIVEMAHQIYYLDESGVQRRLQAIAGITIAEPLYNSIKILIQPKEFHQALEAYVRICESFDTIDFGYGMPLAPPNEEKVALTKLPPAPSTSFEHRVDLSSPYQAARLLQHSISGTACDYLSATDNHLEPKSLQPASKRRAFCLMVLVFHDQLPDPKSDIYYLFGFAACESQTAVGILGRRYKEILTKSRDKLLIFEELWQSLESDKLATFFYKAGWRSFRTDLPLLEHFFSLSLDTRPSVYRLIQFLRVEEGTYEDTDPIACGGCVLIRDYGFHLCKGRDEVKILKDAYRQVLMKFNALELHEACVQMRLSDIVLASNTTLDKKYQRLFQNQGPLPDLGYEKIISDFRCRKGLFKREMKRDRAAGRIW